MSRKYLYWAQMDFPLAKYYMLHAVLLSKEMAERNSFIN